MEQPEVKKRGRGRPRKRRREDEEDEREEKVGNTLKRQAFDISWKPLVGRYLMKEFPGNGIFLGKVVYYDRGLYRVDYEDGDCEDLEGRELRDLILWDDLNDDLSRRKWKLDEMLRGKHLKRRSEEIKVPTRTKRASRNSQDDSANESSDSDREENMESNGQVLLAPQPSLPSSSGTINLPDECVSHFFSVYTFLRSFSVHLFLYPFSVDEFAGAINCQIQNNLIDAIHVALMHAIRRHLEALCSDGSELPVKCLRFINWSLLDTYTWPAYVFHYFVVFGYAERPEWSGLYDDIFKKEFYLCSPSRKINILQLLCDDALDSSELRTEIDVRSEAEVGSDPDLSATHIPDIVPRRIHPRYSKTSLCKDGNDLEHNDGADDRLVSQKYISYGVSTDADGNVDECRLCGMDGTLICCDGCPSAYHTRCVGLVKTQIPDGTWYCPECTFMNLASISSAGTSLNGAMYFGVDTCGQLFLGTCNHLLVLSISGLCCHRYYNDRDILGFLQLLMSTEHRTEYMDLAKAIAQHWNLHSLIDELISPSSSSVNDIKAEREVSPDLFELDPHSSDAKPVDFSKMNEILPYSNGDVCYNDGSNQPSDCYSVGKKQTICNLFMGTTFKPHMYVNHYVNGEFSALAAAKLAILYEESRGLEVHKVSSGRKASPDISLQVKAFSAASQRFFWPCHEKKEIPRERCGWCYSCKLPSNNRRGCYLNAATSTATKGALKVLSGLRPSISGEGSLRSISTYILYLEEMLHGVTVGLFKNANLRAQWRKSVEDVPNLKAIKRPLLEFEESIRSIGLSSEWHKTPDDLCLESFVIPTALLFTSTLQKRAHGNKYSRKSCNSFDSSADDVDDKCYLWWNGGNQSNYVCYKANLPRAVVRKAARQSGAKKITGVFYADECGVPKRSRSLAWKSSTESCQSSSQLAFQVRYLDSHVRWNDLVRSDQNVSDPKGSDTESSFFRNAVICDKRMEENRIIYGVDFKDQKHLPLRIMKSVNEVEQLHGGKSKYWFWEMNIPLYLIKEFEEKFNENTNKSTGSLSKLQRKQLKESRRDVFSFLVSRRDDVERCLCASCEKEILLRNTTACFTCQGFCHIDCTVISSSSAQANCNVLVCLKCCNKKEFSSNSEVIRESPTTPLPSSVPNSGSLKASKLNSYNSHAEQPYHRKDDFFSEAKLAPSISDNKRKICNWGLIWRKKREDAGFDSADDFREKHVITKGNPDKSWLTPVCRSCNKNYNPELMYIHCEKCDSWFHAEALELEESRLHDLIGFKCCRCRRIKPPPCPYSDEPEKLVTQRNRSRATKQESETVGTPFELHESEFLYEHELLDPVADDVDSNPMGAKKLPVRRHGKNDSSVDELAEWNYEDMEFEPQTYFSFTELLSEGECGKCTGRDPMPDLFCNGCGLLLHSFCSPCDQCTLSP